MTLCISYHIITHPLPEIPPLPEAYIVSAKDGVLQYIEKQATHTTLQSTTIEYKNTAHENLLAICEDLKRIALEKRFQPKKSRKKILLTDLIKDPKTKEVLFNFIIRKLSTFYQIITKENYLLCLGAVKNGIVEPTRIQTDFAVLSPILHFTKTDTGITYSFSLQENETIIIPKAHDIVLLLNEPSYLLLDQKLVTLKNLNANKIKPFLTKERIQIPQKHLNTYLEKVIVPVIKNIDVQADGFEIDIHKELTTYTLEILEDFSQKNYIAKVIFAYTHASFDYQSNKKTSTQIDMDATSQIRILQTHRNPEAEKEVIDLLITKGLRLNDSFFLEVPDAEDPFEILTWIKNNQPILEKKRFSVVLPKIRERTINLQPFKIQLNTSSHEDWFDIHGTVTIGNKHISFQKFIPFIRDNNRHFPIDENSMFIIPLSWMSRYKQLATFGKQKGERFTITKSNYTVLGDIVAPEAISIQKQEETHYQPSSLLKASLRPYQLEGVKWLIQHHQNGLGACLADDMGLGKTLQTIAMLIYAKENLSSEPKAQKQIQFDLFSEPLDIQIVLNALIVLPSSLVFNWAQEIRKFAPHFSIALYTGPDRKKLAPYLDSYDIVLTSYPIVTRDSSILQKFNYHYLVIDESQQIKNKESKVFQLINQIPARNKISLSGTPIENSLSDLWSQMQFINPGILGNFDFFKEHFKIPIEKHRDTERMQELKTLIDPFILRRTKEQVAPDLPELSEQVLYSEMTPEQEQSYESEKSAARNTLLKLDSNPKNKIQILNTLMKLRQLANHPILINEKSKIDSGKFTDVIEFLSTLIKADKKVLVFSSFVSHLELYEKWCRKNKIQYVTLTGKTVSKTREQVVHQFQTDANVSVFFISLKAGGVGLNLTEASYVILLDPWWNPFAENQAIARAHRIGQKNKVLVTRFISKNTIEEKILKLQEKKRKLSDDIIDITTLPAYIEEELVGLLQ